MTIDEAYAKMGGDLADFKSRIPIERLQNKFLLMFLNDPSFSELQASFGKDANTAFRAAHTLKGASLNLGLKKLGTSASALTEALRPGNAPVPFAQQQEMYKQICIDYKLTCDTINEFKASNGL